MAFFVLDASIAFAWCFEDEGTPYSEGVLSKLESAQAIVPALWSFEIANILALGIKRGRISIEGSAVYLERLRNLPIHVEYREALWICQQ